MSWYCRPPRPVRNCHGTWALTYVESNIGPVILHSAEVSSRAARVVLSLGRDDNQIRSSVAVASRCGVARVSIIGVCTQRHTWDCGVAHDD